MQIPRKEIFFSCIILFLWTWGLINAFTNHIPMGLGFISIGFAFFSIYLGLLSFETSKKSERIANESDEKMKAVANATFMEIYEDIQDGFLNIKPRLNSNNPKDNNMRSTLIWKYRNSLMRAIELKKYANETNQLNLILPLVSMIELMPWTGGIIINNDVENLLDCYLFSKEFKVNKKTRDELDKLIETHIVERKQDEDVVSCVTRKKDELTKTPNQYFKK